MHPTVVLRIRQQRLGDARHACEIPFSAASTQDDIAASIATSISGSGVGLTPTYFGDGHVHVGGTPNHTLVISGVAESHASPGMPGVQTSTVLVVPPQAAGVGGIADGQWFTIQNRPDDPVRVRVRPRRRRSRPVRARSCSRSTSTVDQLAGYIIAAINLADVGLTPTYLGRRQDRPARHDPPQDRHAQFEAHAVSACPAEW